LQSKHWEKLSELSPNANRFDKPFEEAKQKQLEVYCGR